MTDPDNALQVACIAPVAHIGLSSYGDYDFCLAHIAAAESDYASYFKRQREKGRFVILDNGAYEIGNALSDNELMSIIEYIRPSEVVAPDVMFDSIATSTRLEMFFKNHAALIHSMGIRIMVVPQGRGISEWTEHVKRVSEDFFFDTLGVPKWVSGIERRDDALLRLGPRTLHKFEHIHLLGMTNIDELRGFRVTVRSIDSKQPVKAVMLKESFFNANLPPITTFFDDDLGTDGQVDKTDYYNIAVAICKDFVATSKHLYGLQDVDILDGQK